MFRHFRILLTLASLLLLGAVPCLAQQPRPATPAPSLSKDEQQVRQSVMAFVELYNAHKAYSQNGKSQSVKGVYALDGNVLAMEPESGGVMLAEVTPPQAGRFGFALLGAPPGDPGLQFTKIR